MPTNTELITCNECALNISVPEITDNTKALCPRCNFVVSTKHHNAIDHILAFAITALIFLIASLFFNFLSFTANGIESTYNIVSGFFFLLNNHYEILALIEFITIFLIPIVILISAIYLSLSFKIKTSPAYGEKIITLMFKLIPWNMAEIFLIGALVSLIKLISMANITLGISFYAYVLFSLAMTAALFYIDKTHFYQLLREHKNKGNRSNKLIFEDENKHKKQKSTQYTWALLITSILLYIPANTLPIMNTQYLGQSEPSTILGGIILLWNMGSYPIALIIFIASIIVPVAKIFILLWLNYTVQIQSTRYPLKRIKLYRLAEFVGRWSMIDVFVVIILASLVQLGNVMSIYPGTATLAFTGVVIMTMLAAMNFNTLLIWDTLNNNE